MTMMIKYKRIFVKNLWQLFGATIGLLLLVDIRPCHSWPPLEQQAKQNVTCIAHDTKFTCDCRNANQPMQLPHLIGYVYQVEITNCPSLEVEAYALTETQGLRKVLFRDVKNLVLHENALAFPRTASNTALIIEFQQVSIKLMDSHAIDGNIEEISFVGGHIETIRPFGFTTVKERAVLLKMDRVWIRHIEPQAFKKFAVEDMEILNCVFEENLPSKSFYELEIKHALRIHNNRFKEVHTRAFSLKLVSKLSIVANNFVATDAEWIEAFISNALLISENQFGNTSAIAFKGLQVHRDYMRSEPLELKFLNNTLTSPYTLRPLEFNERFALQLKSLRYENVYDCSDLDRTQKPAVPSTTFFREHSDNIYFMDQESSSSSSQQANQRFLVLSKIIANDCQHTTYLWWIIGGVGLLVILFIVIIVIVCAVRGKRKRKRRKLDIVQPEPRTYTETQIVYQIETAGLIKTDL